MHAWACAHVCMCVLVCVCVCACVRARACVRACVRGQCGAETGERGWEGGRREIETLFLDTSVWATHKVYVTQRDVRPLTVRIDSYTKQCCVGERRGEIFIRRLKRPRRSFIHLASVLTVCAKPLSEDQIRVKRSARTAVTVTL